MYAPKKWFDLYPMDSVELPAVDEKDLEDISNYAMDLTEGSVAPRHKWMVENKQWKHAVRSYLACVSFVDDCIGKVLRSLYSSEYADNTIVVLWGDHGWHLGEKLRWAKRSLWEESTRAPLIISAPGIEGDVRTTRPAGMIDIYPTLLELCNFRASDDLEGTSLVPLLKDPDIQWERPVITTFGPGNHSVRSERWRYIRYADGSEELYDHRDDPCEWHNLAGDRRYSDIIAEHKKWLPRVNVPELPNSKGADSPLYKQ